jgi:hypothetical protein
MGDRAMAEIKVTNGSLFFYTHWCGLDLPKLSKQALEEAKPRIGDDSYALKIVVDSLIRQCHSRDSETGCGLMLKPSAEDEYNNDNPSVLIDLIGNKVVLLGEHPEVVK